PMADDVPRPVLEARPLRRPPEGPAKHAVVEGRGPLRVDSRNIQERDSCGPKYRRFVHDSPSQCVLYISNSACPLRSRARTWDVQIRQYAEGSQLVLWAYARGWLRDDWVTP